MILNFILLFGRWKFENLYRRNWWSKTEMYSFYLSAVIVQSGKRTYINRFVFKSNFKSAINSRLAIFRQSKMDILVLEYQIELNFIAKLNKWNIQFRKNGSKMRKQKIKIALVQADLTILKNELKSLFTENELVSFESSFQIHCCCSKLFLSLIYFSRSSIYYFLLIIILNCSIQRILIKKKSNRKQ